MSNSSCASVAVTLKSMIRAFLFDWAVFAEQRQKGSLTLCCQKTFNDPRMGGGGVVSLISAVYIKHYTQAVLLTGWTAKYSHYRRHTHRFYYTHHRPPIAPSPPHQTHHPFYHRPHRCHRTTIYYLPPIHHSGKCSYWEHPRINPMKTPQGHCVGG